MTSISDYDNKDIQFLLDQGILNGMIDDFKHPEDMVTTKQFITMVIRSSKGDIESTENHWSSGYIQYALSKGIMEDYDRTNLNHPIERRSAARIVHETLLTECIEKDELDWSAAEQLLDLYTCRTCVMHIAQVYVKGIMVCREDNVFDVLGFISLSEAAAIVVRMFDKTKRIPKRMDKGSRSQSIQPEEAWEMISANSKLLLMDVRTHDEYKEGHIDGSICMPLQDIVNNPFSVSVRKDTPIILYCQKGYKSSLAAQVLLDVGYSKVYTIPGIEQYPYKLIS